MRTKFAVIVGTVLVAVLVCSSVALASGPFAVTKKVPTGGATGVATTANVKAYFNHNIKASTVTSSTFKIKKDGTTSWLGATRSVNNTITPTSTNGSSESVATLNPSADLASNTTYKVVVVGGSSGVKDSNGAALAANKSWSFTTVGATPSLTVLSPMPSPGSTDISTSTTVTATFSNDGNNPTDMLASSINANTFWLTFEVDPDNHLTAQVSYDPATKTATLDPSGLQDGASYTATIKGGSNGVKDAQGKSLAQNFSWTFHTAPVVCIIIC